MTTQTTRTACSYCGVGCGISVQTRADPVTGAPVIARGKVSRAQPTAARNSGGWYVCLEELAKSLDGVPSRGPHSEDTVPWEPVYRAHVDAGLPSGAPIPDIAAP